MSTLFISDRRFGDAAASRIRLADGRALAYTEYGDPDGTPLFHFHGHPGSRLEAGLMAEPAARLGVRLIGVDRPGMGLSDFQADRRIIDWPSDVAQLADGLELERFSVQGISGGGPFAAAVAQQLPDRVRSLTLISSAAPAGLGAGSRDLPANRLQARMAQTAPWTLDLAFTAMSRSVHRSVGAQGTVAVGRSAVSGLPSVDQHALQPDDRADQYGRSLREAFRQGGKGAAWDARLLAGPWGFDLGEIAVPTSVWQGGQDRNVAPETGAVIATSIPGAVLHYHEAEGHISVAFAYADEIIAGAAQPS